MGLRTYLKEYYRNLTEKYPFDFVIGSVHMIRIERCGRELLFEAAEKLLTEAYQRSFR